MKKQFVFCVDVEPRDRLVYDSTGQWDNFPELHNNLKRLREEIFKLTGTPARFSWFLRMDHQIKHSFGSISWLAENFYPLLEELKSHGDEIGLHPHGFRWSDSTGKWINDFADQVWINDCVASAIDAYVQVFKTVPYSFRFGDHWLNDSLVSLLEDKGVACDLTIEPGKRRENPMKHESSTDDLPDYRKAPTFPYHPSKENFLTPGISSSVRTIWMIPLTMVRYWRYSLRYPFLKRKLTNLNLAYSPNVMSEVIKQAFTENNIVISVLRSGDLELKPLEVLGNLELIGSINEVRDFRFSTPKDIVDELGTTEMNTSKQII